MKPLIVTAQSLHLHRETPRIAHSAFVALGIARSTRPIPPLAGGCVSCAGSTITATVIRRLRVPPIRRHMLAQMRWLIVSVILDFRIRRPKTRLSYVTTVMPTITALGRDPDCSVLLMLFRPHSRLMPPSVTVIGDTRA